jgi:asparagine synthase (glutamine-hydrolysing)
MCGIVGFCAGNNKRQEREMAAIATEMAKALHHRGPDTGGVWVGEEAELALAHRRLSIIDLSTNGNQPMCSGSGHYVIVFNGEIYNYRQLRQDLASRGKTFRGHSDTEVVLAGCEEWGVERTIRKCVGMFAMAVWDTKERDIYLVRDRMGEKPLYYGWQKGTFLFASELKALKRHPDFQGELDRDSLSLYFRHKYIPAPYTIYQNVFKLMPGTILKLSIHRNGESGNCGSPEFVRYWSLKQVAEEGELDGYSGTAGEAVQDLEALLLTSVEGQMIADVPLGAFLSGGIDSSTVVALMQKLSAKPVRTFCIGFEEQGYNEAAYAKRIAQHLGCQHTELYVTPRQTMDVIPSMPRLYDEPFADASQIPTFLLSRLAVRDVTVSLSGDGGDELFYGYGVYPLLFRRCRLARRINLANRSLQELALKLVRWVGRADQRRLAVVRSLLSSATFVEVYRSMVSVSPDPSALVLNSSEPATVFSRSELPNMSTRENTIMVLDALSYLPDDILVKVDRAAMACSLETRIPLLDHRIVEFAFRLPFQVKFRGGTAKWPLRQILYKYVPRDLVERPKKGFGIPIGRWLRHELREWAHDSLDDKTVREDGVLNVDRVRQYVREHMNGRQDHSEMLWALLMFQCWLHGG